MSQHAPLAGGSVVSHKEHQNHQEASKIDKIRGKYRTGKKQRRLVNQIKQMIAPSKSPPLKMCQRLPC